MSTAQPNVPRPYARDAPRFILEDPSRMQTDSVRLLLEIHIRGRFPKLLCA